MAETTARRSHSSTKMSDRRHIDVQFDMYLYNVNLSGCFVIVFSYLL